MAEGVQGSRVAVLLVGLAHVDADGFLDFDWTGEAKQHFMGTLQLALVLNDFGCGRRRGGLLVDNSLYFSWLRPHLHDFSLEIEEIIRIVLNGQVELFDRIVGDRIKQRDVAPQKPELGQLEEPSFDCWLVAE